MTIEGKTVFITGGAGFIGSTLTGRLVEKNKIVVFDTFARDSLKDKAFANHENITKVQGDVLDLAALQKAMKGADLVVHCAAIAGIDTVARKPVTTLKVNVLGSANVLDAAAGLSKCDRVVCFSTSEIYGQHAFRVSETDKASVGAVGEPRWVYAVGKLAEEHWALAYHKEQGLPAVVVRPFNVYGPGQVGEGAIRNFVQRALRDEPIQIYGNGAQIRSWCYVDDMVDAVLLSLEHPRAVGESFNIGNERAVATTRALAETTIRVLGSKSTIVHATREGADVELRVPDTKKAKDFLGFDAKVDLDEGLRRTGEFFRSRSHA